MQEPFLVKAQSELASLVHLEIAERRNAILQRSPKLPQSLYHYRGYSTPNDITNLKDILINSRLFLRAPSDFNDPFDCKFNYSGVSDQPMLYEHIIRGGRHLGYSHREIRKVRNYMNPSGLEQIKRFAKDIMESLFNKSGIFCFTEDYKNVLMWSHYAEKHTGVCIEFDTTAAYKILPIAHPVDYHGELPLLSFPEEDPRKIIAPIFRKAKHWEYEKEWRLAIPDLSHQYVDFAPDSIRSLIYGCRSDEVTRSVIENILETRKNAGLPAVRTRRLAQDRHGYALIEDAHGSRDES